MLIRFFAGAAEAAGRDSTEIDAAGLTAADVIDHLSSDNQRLARVLRVSSLLADGARLSGTSADLSGIATLDILPPFAGG